MEKYITEKEIWKPIKGYEGRYEVSNFGSVKSLDRIVDRLDNKGRPSYVTVKGRMLKPTLSVRNTGGYETVKLMIDNKGKTKKVHRLVAEAFIPNPNKYPEVNHKNEVKTNNHMSNLEWCTKEYNNSYGTRYKRIHSHPNSIIAMKEFGKPMRKKVKATCLKTGVTKIYKSMLSAENDGFDSGHISKVCKGKRKQHKGFKWEYI